jgi:putative NADPH-quinone reductase
MKKLIVFGHPKFEESKFNRALLNHLNLNNIELLNVNEYLKTKDYTTARKRFEKADEIIYQFPLYWFGEPHNFKQFNEELFIHGWAFSFDGESALKGKRFRIITTAASPVEAYAPGGRYKYPVTDYLLPLRGLTLLSEMNYIDELIFYSCLEEPTNDQIKDYLDFLGGQDE